MNQLPDTPKKIAFVSTRISGSDGVSMEIAKWADVLEHMGPHKQAIGELMRVARKKVIITVPAYKWLYGEYDRLLGHKRRYYANDFSGFKITYLFWFLVPIIFLRKILKLKHRPLPPFVDRIFYFLSKPRLNFGTTIMAEKCKVSDEEKKKHKVSIFIPVLTRRRYWTGISGPLIISSGKFL